MNNVMRRGSGVLFPVFSLPSKYGIGTIGGEAKKFIDFLAKTEQNYWQILPVGPTSYGDSPYQSFSTFAGNPYLIDLELLIDDGILTKDECESVNWGNDPGRIDYARIYNNRFVVLRKAFERGYERDKNEVSKFTDENSTWIEDYSLFMALKNHFGMKSWIEWDDEDIRLRRPGSVEKYSELLEDDIAFYKYLQYLFFRQWNELKKYAKSNKIKIIGDMPIYVAMDSADVWSSPGLFKLDENNMPVEVAGVPPDYFTADGQLWGNPLYRWDKMKEDGYGWWIRRLDGAVKLYDIIRIDHFRGFESYWSVPYGEKTAKNGRWIKGPGMDFVGTMTGWFKDTHFIAEDLGYLTPEVRKLLSDSGLPGMKVLEFAFDSREPSNYLPHTYLPHCICYAGTHDNATLADWLNTADRSDIALAVRYLGLNKKEGYIRGVIRGGMSSVAELFIAQMQDWLELGPEARINTPGTATGNWQWRIKSNSITKELIERMIYTTRIYGRSDKPWQV